MIEKHFYRFPTVDFFGKTMPGVIFTLLSIPLLPFQVLENGNNAISESLPLVILFIFVVIVVGFAVGQGLNTVTVIFEKSVYRIGINMYRLAHFMGIPDYEFWEELELESREDGPTHDEEDLKTIQYQRVKLWFWKRYINFKRIFLPHRQSFANRIQRHKADEKPEFYDDIELFESQYRAMAHELHGNPPPYPNDQETVDEVVVPDELYPIVSSYLTNQDIQRAQRYKSLYIFCRNVAVVSLFYTGIYGIAAFHSVISGGLPPIVSESVQSDLFGISPVVPIVLLTTSLIFFYSTGEYKRYYIEYLIADFIHTSPSNEGILL